MQEHVNALVDGVSSALIDLSTLGAQVLCCETVGRNGTVEIALLSGSGPVRCKARVLWNKVERAEIDTSLLRAGVQFIEADASAIQAFITERGALNASPSPSLEV
jgi:hypothetical protein